MRHSILVLSLIVGLAGFLSPVLSYGITTYIEQSGKNLTCSLSINQSDYTEEELKLLEAKLYQIRNVGNVAPQVNESQARNLIASRGFYMARHQIGYSWQIWKENPVTKNLRIYLPYVDEQSDSKIVYFTFEDNLNELLDCHELRAQTIILIRDREGTAEFMRTQSQDIEGSLGRAFLSLEKKNLGRQDMDFNLAETTNKYLLLLQKLKKEAAKFDTRNIITANDLQPLRDSIIRKLQGYGLGSDCQGNSQMSSYFLRSCGDCNSNTMLLLSVWRDLKLPAPKDYVLGAMEYLDHIAPVLYNAKTNDVVDLYTWNRSSAGLNPIMNPEYLVHNAYTNVGLRILEGEEKPKIPDGQVLFRPEKPEAWVDPQAGKISALELSGAAITSNIKTKKPDLIFDATKFPESYSCFIPDCKSPKKESQHDLYGKLEELKAFNGDPPDTEIIRELPFCPFVLTLPRSPKILEEAMDYPAVSKIGFKISQLPPGYFWQVKTTDLNYNAVRCTDRQEARVVLEPKSAREIKNEIQDLDPLNQLPDAVANIGAYTQKDNYLSQPMQRRSINKESVAEQLSKMDKIWGRHYRAILEVPKYQCPKDQIVNAIQLCKTAQRFQEDSANIWSRQVYPTIRDIVGNTKPIEHFKRQEAVWKNLRDHLQESHQTLFNNTRPDQEVAALLIKTYPQFPQMIQDAQDFRKSLGQYAAYFLKSVSELTPEQQVLVFEVFSEISYHISYVTRLLREQNFELKELNEKLDGTNFTEENLAFAGGLTELVLRAYVQTPQSEEADQETTKLELAAQEKGQTISAVKQRPKGPKINLPKVDWNIPIDCSEDGPLYRPIGGNFAVQCPNMQAQSFNNLEISALVLPLMMAEAERETLRPQNLLMTAQLWTEENEQALKPYQEVPFIKSFFTSGVEFLNRNRSQIAVDSSEAQTFDWIHLAFLRLFTSWNGQNWNEIEIQNNLTNERTQLLIRELKKESSQDHNVWAFQFLSTQAPSWIANNTLWLMTYQKLLQSPLFKPYFEAFNEVSKDHTSAHLVYTSQAADFLIDLVQELFFVSQMRDTVVQSKDLVFDSTADKFTTRLNYLQKLTGIQVTESDRASLSPRQMNRAIEQLARFIMSGESSPLLNMDRTSQRERAREVREQSQTFKSLANAQALQVALSWADNDGDALWSDVDVSRERLDQSFFRPQVHYGRHVVIEKINDIEIFPWSDLLVRTWSDQISISVRSNHNVLIDWQQLLERTSN